MKITLIHYPGDTEWQGCLQRARVTVGKDITKTGTPSEAWRRSMLDARHSPIRYLTFGFLLEGVPGNTATHFVRHVHSQPYVSTLRNDRQSVMDGDKAPRDTPVTMIIDMNAEELMTMANKRLCMQAAARTREVMQAMASAVIEKCPEFEGFLVPMCEYHGGICHEMRPCGKYPKYKCGGIKNGK